MLVRSSSFSEASEQSQKSTDRNRDITVEPTHHLLVLFSFSLLNFLCVGVFGLRVYLCITHVPIQGAGSSGDRATASYLHEEGARDQTQAA